MHQSRDSLCMQGRITSFYSTDLQRYTSYRGHSSSAPRGAPGNAPVKQFLFCEKGVISLSSKSVHLANRRGLTQWHIALPDMVDLRCMSFTNAASTELVIAGCQPQMYRIHFEKGSIPAGLRHLLGHRDPTATLKARRRATKAGDFILLDSIV